MIIDTVHTRQKDHLFITNRSFRPHTTVTNVIKL